MMNILNFYEAGKARSGTALFPLLASPRIDIMISTRNYNLSIDFGYGNTTSYTTPKLHDYAVLETPPALRYNYSSDFTGDVKVKAPQGLADIYSLCTSYGGLDAIFNIPDLEIFLKQFPKLYSYRFHQHNVEEPSKAAIIKGDFAKSPKYIKRIYVSALDVVNSTTDILINISNFPNDSELVFFEQGNIGSLKTTGDISKIPISTSFFKISSVVRGSSITYTAGKVWASSFDTLSIPLALSHTENNAMLADMDGSVSTSTGAKVIENPGYRTGASDAYVSSLNAKGFTVNIPKYSITPQKILDLDFQNNFTDSTGLNTMVAGGSSNQPTFALSGRKAGEYCAVFNGSQSIKTTTNLPVNSDKVTIAFWIKTTQTSTSAMIESSSNYTGVNGFAMFLNDLRAGKIELGSGTSTIRKFVDSSDNVNSGTWMHIVGVIDRAVTPTSVKIYVNGIDVTTLTSLNSNNTGDFTSQILFIGQRAGSSAGFNGSLTKLKIYNYPLTAGEVSTLYNSEL